MQSIYSRLSNIYVVKVTVTVTASESVSISHAGLLKINLFYSAKHAHRTCTKRYLSSCVRVRTRYLCVTLYFLCNILNCMQLLIFGVPFPLRKFFFVIRSLVRLLFASFKIHLNRLIPIKPCGIFKQCSFAR